MFPLLLWIMKSRAVVPVPAPPSLLVADQTPLPEVPVRLTVVLLYPTPDERYSVDPVPPPGMGPLEFCQASNCNRYPLAPLKLFPLGKIVNPALTPALRFAS